MPLMTAHTYLGIGKEAVRNVGASASAFLPIEPPQWTTHPTWLEDKGVRGNPVSVYSEQIGVRYDEYAFKGNVFLDTAPNFLMAMLGIDNVTGSGPYVHSMGIVNAVAEGSQPYSYTLTDFDAGVQGATTARQLTGGILSELSFAFAANAALGMTGKWMTQAAGSVSTVGNPPSYSTQVFVPAWNCAASVNGVGSGVILDGTIDIKRNTEAIFTLGNQSPYRLWDGPMDISGKLTYVYEVGDPRIYQGTHRLSPVGSLNLLFTEPTSGYTMQINLSQMQQKNPQELRTKSYVEVEVEFMAEGNVTDGAFSAGTGPGSSTSVAGYSPISVIVTNGNSSAY